jgi:hypothetical protein
VAVCLLAIVLGSSVARFWDKPEFPFWPRKRHHSTPVSPVRDTIKRFFIGSAPYDLPSAAAQPKIAPFVAYFCNTSPSPNQLSRAEQN